jgi:hypothetical protein
MSEGFGYIEREYKAATSRVELQRRVFEQLQIIDADASQAEASLNEASLKALLDDEAPKRLVLNYLKRWLGDKLEANRDWRLPYDIIRSDDLDGRNKTIETGRADNGIWHLPAYKSEFVGGS